MSATPTPFLPGSRELIPVFVSLSMSMADAEATTMMRWITIAIFCAGIFTGLGIAIAAEHSDNRHGLGSIKHARSNCLHNCQNQAVRRSKHRFARHAKSRHSQIRVFSAGRPVVSGRGPHRVGIPQNGLNYRAEGKASWYGRSFHGRRTANGEIFDMNELSAAHRTLPMQSLVRVTNLENRRSLVVRLNDRGPYHGHRLIDVSVRVAKFLGFYDQGLARVRVEYVGQAALDGSKYVKLASTRRHEDSSSLHVAASGSGKR